MSDEQFKLPGSSYTELAKIVRAYAHANDEASLDDVAKRAAVDSTFVSRNNGFLLSVGILTGGKKKSLTPKGRLLAQALDFELISQIQGAWLDLVSESDFFRKIVSAVRIRNGMDATALKSHIAYTAGAPNKPATMTGANAVIDVLRQAGILKEVDGKMVALDWNDLSPSRESANSIQHADSGPAPSGSESVALTTSMSNRFGINVQLHINIECKVDEIGKLSESLKDLFHELGLDVS